MRRPRVTASVSTITHVKLPDRPLIRIDADHPFWTRVNVDRVFEPDALEGAIVWLKPPAKPGLRVQEAAQWLRDRGAHVKLLPPDRVDDVVVEERTDRAPELGADQAREVVYQLCRELADQAGVPRETVIEQVEPYLAGAGL